MLGSAIGRGPSPNLCGWEGPPLTLVPEHNLLLREVGFRIVFSYRTDIHIDSIV